MSEPCPKCGGELIKSKAFVNVATPGAPDFFGSEVVTMSYGKAAKLIDCLKCSACGWSVTNKKTPVRQDAPGPEENKEKK